MIVHEYYAIYMIPNISWSKQMLLFCDQGCATCMCNVSRRRRPGACWFAHTYKTDVHDLVTCVLRVPLDSSASLAYTIPVAARYVPLAS